MKRTVGRNDRSGPTDASQHEVSVGPLGLPGILSCPPHPLGIILFAHGSGSSRLSPRNTYVAKALNRSGFATLLFDLLTPEEEADRRNVFDIALLADRLCEAIEWVSGQPRIAPLAIGLFGASTGAAAALVAAASLKDSVAAVVSRGGRPDMAAHYLEAVQAPTLLIVGGDDTEVLDLNRSALDRLQATKALEIVPGATHLFSEPGALDAVVAAAAAWFESYLDPAHLA